MKNDDDITPGNEDSFVQLHADKIADAVQLGPEKASLSTTEQIMVALATEDHQAWLPGSTAQEKELWARMDRIQMKAIAKYANDSRAHPDDK